MKQICLRNHIVIIVRSFFLQPRDLEILNLLLNQNNDNNYENDDHYCYCYPTNYKFSVFLTLFRVDILHFSFTFFKLTR